MSAKDGVEAWATVARFTTPHEAELAATALDARGIAARVLDAETVGVASLLSAALGGVRLQVPAGREAAAAEVLSAISPTREAVDEDALAEEALAAEALAAGEAPPERADVGAAGDTRGLAAVADTDADARAEASADAPWRALRAMDAPAIADDADARRALGAALLGLVLPLLPNLYSLVLAVPALSRWPRLTGRARGWLLMALGVDVAALAVVAALVLA